MRSKHDYARWTGLVGAEPRFFMWSRKASARALANLLRWSLPDLPDNLGPWLAGYAVPPERGEDDAEPDRQWIDSLANSLTREFSGRQPSLLTLMAHIQRDSAFVRGMETGWFFAAEFENEAPSMRPASGAPQAWKVRPIETLGDLAQWLSLDGADLGWFADQRSLEAAAPNETLRHYHRRWEPKRDGTFRLIENPKQRLKAIQRAILREILERIPIHENAHGFQKGRSILTFVRGHTAKHIVLRLDLQNFFPTISRARICNVFLTAGYPEPVAQALAGICTTICPGRLIGELPDEQRRNARALYLRKHLPQGAPTSPSLANLCAFNFDCRLAGLVKASGAHFSRYADDLIFSGDAEFARGAERFLVHVMAIALEEGFQINARKTRVMRQGVAQTAVGLRLNAKPNISRQHFDALKAILTNCVRHGPESQNRDAAPNFCAVLAGKIAHVKMVNAEKAKKLEKIFAQISWP